jgi:two-component system sensor histidine kinase VanS
MKSFVRFKLFIWVCGIIVFFILFSWFLNINFLNKYYLYEKKKVLLENYSQINKIIKDKPFVYSIELEKIERTQNIRIMILDKKFNIIYDSQSLGSNLPAPPPYKNPRNLLVSKIIEDVKHNKPGIDVIFDKRLNSNFIYKISKLANGDSISLDIPAAAISESVAIANRFSLITGIITMLLGSILILMFSKKFTKPIKELNTIAQAISRLDFSKKCTIRTRDEIGELGKSINSISVQLDKSINELKINNEKLKEDILTERKIDKMRRDIISNVSHELKTPITLINGYSIGLKSKVHSDEINRDYYCDVIIDEAEKMDKLVRDLLELSQMESGVIKLEKEKFELSSMVEHLLEKYLPIFSENNIELTKKLNKKYWVMGDKLRLEQVMTNYINNAINYVDANKKINIELFQKNGKVQVSIYNTCKSIPAASINKLWDSFYKVDKARTRTLGGAGLGLSIVKNIMELHNNNYGAENISEGVRFWFELDLII